MKRINHYLLFAIALLLSVNVSAQTLEITGKVTDVSGQPLQGVTVFLQGASSYTVTNNDGTYSINADRGQTIKFSAIGFVTKEITVSDQKIIHITLEEEVFNVEELMVIGYGSQSKRTVTSSIAKVSGDEIQKSTVTSATEALKGKVAGARIFTPNNSPGAEPTILIRGGSSISGNNDPLILVDGIERDLSGINPNDIESMEILKDAASAAIYGAEAGNGVVLITTKKGEEGTASISYSGKFINQSLGHRAEMLNAQQFIDYKRLQGYAIDDMLNNAKYNGTDTDWFNEYFNPAWSTQHTLSLQGGNRKGHYFSALSYVNQDGIIKGDKDLYKRFTAQLNTDYSLFDWFEVGNNVSFEQWSTKSVSQQGYGSAFESLMTIDPCTPVYWTDPSQFNQDYKNKYDAVLAGASEFPYSFLGDENGWFATSAIDETRGCSPFVQRDGIDGGSEGINI